MWLLVTSILQGPASNFLTLSIVYDVMGVDTYVRTCTCTYIYICIYARPDVLDASSYAAHAVRTAFENEAVLLADAFNSLNRQVALHNIRRLCMRGPPLATITILSHEGRHHVHPGRPACRAHVFPCDNPKKLDGHYRLDRCFATGQPPRPPFAFTVPCSGYTDTTTSTVASSRTMRPCYRITKNRPYCNRITFTWHCRCTGEGPGDRESSSRD